MNSWYRLKRGWQEHPVFRNEPFSRRDAFVWLIEQAVWKPTKISAKGEIITIERGELSFSQRFLAERWRWSKSRVDRFLSELRDQGMIKTRSKNGATPNHKAGQGQAIITVCNYDKYQSIPKADRGNDEPDSGATAGQQRGNSGANKNEGNKGMKEGEAKASPKRNYDSVGLLNRWNELARQYGFTIALKLTDKRRKALRARIDDYGYPMVLEALEAIPTYPVLLGDSDRGWRATFDWFVKPDSVPKILEGFYVKRNGDGRSSIQRALDSILAEESAEGDGEEGASERAGTGEARWIQ